MVGFQQSAQALDADNLAVTRFMSRLNDPVDTLMNPFMMVMCENHHCIGIIALAKVIGIQGTALLARGKQDSSPANV